MVTAQQTETTGPTGSSSSPSWRSRTKILGKFLTWQAAIQFLSAVSGLILVHLLGKPEFALYTVATSLQTILASISDCGVGIGMTSIGGRVWSQRANLSRLTATALCMRFYLLAAGTIVVLPLGAWLLHRNGAATLSIGIGLIVVLATVFFVLSAQILSVPFRLHGAYDRAQRAEFLGVICRVLLIVTVVVFAPNFIIALTAALVGAALQAWTLKRGVHRFVDEDGADERYSGELSSLIKSQVVQTTFFAFQGQIAIWLITVFGTGERVAEVGALSRLAVLFSLVSSVLIGLVSPAFARAQSPERLRSLFAICVASYAAFAAVLLTLTFLFPRAFLFVLGGNYHGLVAELPLSVIATVIGGLIAVLWTLPAARGMVRGTWMIAIGTIATQIVLLRVLDLSSVRSVLLFNIFSSIPTVFVVGFLAARVLRGERQKSPENL